ncbi:MAG: hypothetical protein QXJ31_05135 [Candidatus Bathyarchaeia archaeon]
MSEEDLEECEYCVPDAENRCLNCPFNEEEYPDCFGQYDVESELCRECAFQNECEDWSKEEGEVEK